MGFPIAAQAAPPPPAKPPSTIPMLVRTRIWLETQSDLSQALGVPYKIKSLRSYSEQDGSLTSCIDGTVGGKRLRIAQGHDDLKVQPSKAEWIEVGCTRPGYQLIH